MAPKRSWSLDDARYAQEVYLSGQSLSETSAVTGFSFGIVRKMLETIGQPLRDRTSALRLKDTAKMTEAAHNATRGQPILMSSKIKAAKTRENRLTGLTEEELRVGDFLVGEKTFQKAIGPYNVDIAVNGSIAVELFGGGWHGCGRHQARHAERFEHILNADWDALIVWDIYGCGNDPAAINDELVTLTKIREGDPASPSQCRVIWGTGELWGVFCAEHVYESSIVPTSRNRVHRICGDECFA